MKKTYLITALFAANVLSAQNSDFESISLPTTESYWDGSDYSGVSNGAGLFDTTIVDGGISYACQYDTTWGASWGFWSGWAFTNQTPDTTTGFAGQYSSYAGGANGGSNYAIGQNGSEIILAGTSGGNGIQLQITNANYAASSMLNGDAFAKQFGSPNDADGNPDGTNGEDWFLLTVVGYDNVGAPVDSVDFYLADYRFANNTQDYIVKSWTLLDLSALGTVKKLKFKLNSSDVGQVGMNTPAFFAIDDLTQNVINGIEENNLLTSFYPNPATDIVTIETSASRGTIEILDITGKTIRTENFSTNLFTVNISNLRTGTYFVILVSDDKRQATKLIKL